MTGSPVVSSDVKAARAVLRFFLLVLPFLLALGLAAATLKCPDPLGGNYGLHMRGTVASAEAEDVVRARMAMLVCLEVFALTLLVLPWEFPWRARRWLAAFLVFVPWSGLMMAMAMHAGRILALHGLILAGVVMGILGPVTFVLGLRSTVDYLRARSRAKAGVGAVPAPGLDAPGSPVASASSTTAADAPPQAG